MASTLQTRREADQIHSTAPQSTTDNVKSDLELPDEKIAVRAYYIWEKEGRPWGRDEVHWRLAIEQLKAGLSPIAQNVPPANQASGLRTVRIFLAYRRGEGEGDQYVQALYQKLDGQVITDQGTPCFVLEVFFDRFTPYSADWKSYWNTYLRTARAMLVVCTAGAARRRADGDFLHQEVDTWLRYRRTCPILVDAQNLGREIVPSQILKLWPDAERLDWPPPSDESRLYRRIEQGILLSAIGVDQQDLGRIRRRNKYLTAAAFGLFVLLLAATILAGLAIRARDDAIAQTKTANSRRLAALSVAERDKRLDLSLLLAVEALGTKNTFEARDSLFKALQNRPGLKSFLHMNERYVWSVAFSPDGKILAVGYRGGGGVVLWDVAARKRLTSDPLPIKEGGVESVAFSPDSKTLVASYGNARGGPSGDGSHFGGMVLWDVATRKRLTKEPLPVREGGVESVAFSPDGKTLAAGYGIEPGGPRRDVNFGGVVLWDVAACKRLTDDPLPMNEGRVGCVAFSPDGSTLAAGYGSTRGGGVVLWDVAARKRLADDPLPVGEGFFSVVSFSPDGKTLATGYGGRGPGGVVLWDVAERKRLAADPLPVNEGSVVSVAFSPNGKTLAAGYGGDANGVVVWEVAECKRLADGPLVVTEGDVGGVAFSPDGKTLAAGYGSRDSNGAVLWDVAGSRCLVSDLIVVNEGGVSGVAFSPDGKTLAAGYGNLQNSGGVVLWDVAARKRLTSDPLPVKEGLVGGVAFSPDGKTLAAAFGGGVVLWDTASSKRLEDDPLAVTEGDVRGVTFSPNGKTLATGYSGDPSGVVLWDVTARRRPAHEPLPVKEGLVRCVAFSPDGKILAVAYFGGGDSGDQSGVVLWDVAARKRMTDDPLVVKEGIRCVAFSPDGKTLATGYGGGIAMWNVAVRRRLGNDLLLVEENGLESVAFSPDGKTLAAGYGDASAGGVVVWDVVSRERLVGAPFSVGVRDGGVESVAFSSDGKTLAAGHGVLVVATGGVQLWDMDLESWQRRASQLANRNLTPDELRRFFPDTPYQTTDDNLSVPPSVRRWWLLMSGLVVWVFLSLFVLPWGGLWQLGKAGARVWALRSAVLLVVIGALTVAPTARIGQVPAWAEKASLALVIVSITFTTAWLQLWLDCRFTTADMKSLFSRSVRRLIVNRI